MLLYDPAPPNGLGGWCVIILRILLNLSAFQSLFYDQASKHF